MRKCIVCGRSLERYVPIEQKYRKKTKPETLNREEYSCPYCYAVDRDRLITAFLKRLLLSDDLGDSGDSDHSFSKSTERRFDLLEIAPSGALQWYLNSHWGGVNLYTADLYMPDVTCQTDIQNMEQIEDGAFDMIVCSHVLEHVRSDRQAMREMYRVLDSNGLAVILVPIDLEREYIDEEWGLSEEENSRRFGQKDHVRAYSRRGFLERMQETGFRVFVLDEGYFTFQEFRENAWTQTSALYVACKEDSPYTCRERLAAQFVALHRCVPVEQEYLPASSACNYWLDVCEVTKDGLYLWGWIYIIDHNSRKSKLKVMLKNETNQYLYGTEFRKREDIQERFGQDKCYLYSGIDCVLPLSELSEGIYEIWLLICSGCARYRIDLQQELVINRR